MLPEQTELLESKIKEFTDKTTTISVEGTEIVLKGAESLSLLLSDETVAAKIRTSAMVLSGAYNEYIATMMKAAAQAVETISADIQGYEGLQLGFALRHPIKAKAVNDNLESIKGSWSKIKAVFNPEPKKEEPKQWSPTELQIDNIRYLEKNLLAQSQFNIEELNTIFGLAGIKWHDSMTYAFFSKVDNDWNDILKADIPKVIDHLIKTGEVIDFQDL